jgi:hypothetical protein
MSRAEQGDARGGEALSNVTEGAYSAAASARRLADLFDRYAGAFSWQAGGRERELYLRAMDEIHALKVSVRALSDRVAESNAGRPAEPPDCE